MLCPLLYLCGGVGAVAGIISWFTVIRPPKMSITGKHVLITGGSSGIGLALAKKLLEKRAAIVTILGSTQAKLDAAVKELQLAATDDQKVVGICANVAEPSLVDSIKEHIGHYGAVDILVTSAGISCPDYFETQELETVERVMKVNFMGTIYSVRGVLPEMKKQKNGRLVFISSMAGLSGIVGMSAYSPSKFAVRGLAETLSMELHPYKIGVSLVNPPDVNTPLYESENKTKPEECRLISEGSGLFSAESTADAIIGGIENYKFFINQGLDGFMLGALTVGMAPPDSVSNTLTQCLILPIMRLVSAVYLKSFYGICDKCHKNKESEKKTK